MRMAVDDLFVHVWMGMRLLTIPREVMCVEMMDIMAVTVVVRQRLVLMFVYVPLAHVQPHADGHQCTRQQKGEAAVFSEECHRERGTQERCGGKVGAGSRRTQMTQGQHEQDQAQAVADEPERPGGQHGRCT